MNATTRRRRFRVSYRVSLLVAIPALMIALSGLILWQGYRSTTAEVRRLASTLFGELSRQVIQESREHLTRAGQTVGLLQDLSRLGRLGTDRKRLAAELVAVVRSHPDYTWVSWSDAAGSFTGGYRASDGTLRSNLSWIEDGKTRMEEHAVDASGGWTLVQKSDDYGYDPRSRPFYQKAVKEGRAIWTPPYVFFGQGIPGITYAVPRLDAAGKVEGVFSVDFDLNRLSDIARHAGKGGVGSVFMFTPDGTLLAHPSVTCVESGRADAEGRLLKLADVTDDVVKTYAATSRTADAKEGELRTFDFSVGGEAYFAGGASHRIDDGFSLIVGVTAPAARFLGPVRKNLQRSFYVALGVLAVGVAVAVVFATTIARPLVDMAEEMDRVARFDLRESPPDRSAFTEIHRMEKSLAGMIHSLASFASYVPKDLVRRLVTTGDVARLGGQTRTLTIFFSDVAGFTSMTERLAPDELVRRLGGYFDLIGGQVAAEGGTVDKFIGDAVMAFWGAPEEQPDHAARAVRAALRCRRALEERRGRGEGDVALPTRIGMATGEVVVGNIGTSERMNYTVIGDSVNLAARLEALNKVYGTSILVAEETVRQAGGAAVFRPVDVVAVAGREQGVRIFEPVGTAGDPAAEGLAAETARAFESYLAKDLETAKARYEEVRRLRPGDPVASIMLARCEEYLAKGAPGEGWGVTKFRHK